MFIEKIDAITFFFKRLRVFPRLFMVGYAIMLHIMINWIMGLPDITTAQAIITSAVVTIATPLTKFYIDSGNNLYDDFDNMLYTNKVMKYIDLMGYVTDKLRLVPMGFVVHFAVTLAILLVWCFGLGDALTTEQATFVSIYAGNTSVILGFYMTSDVRDKGYEERYKERLGIRDRLYDNSNVVSQIKEED